MQIGRSLPERNGQDADEASHLQGEAGEDCSAEAPRVDVTNIQSFHVLQQQLHDTISHLKSLQASQDGNLSIEH